MPVSSRSFSTARNQAFGYEDRLLQENQQYEVPAAGELGSCALIDKRYLNHHGAWMWGL